MSTFWKTLKWHQSNTPLTSAFYTFGQIFHHYAWALLPHPVLWLMVCRPGALAHRDSQTLSELSTLSNKFWQVLTSLHSTSRPSRRVAMESTLLESRRSCCCTCWVGLRQWKRSYVKNGERQKEQLVSRSSGEDDSRINHYKSVPQYGACVHIFCETFRHQVTTVPWNSECPGAASIGWELYPALTVMNSDLERWRHELRTHVGLVGPTKSMVQ